MPAVEIGSSAWPLLAKNTAFLSAQRAPAQRRGSGCAVGETALNGTRRACPGDGAGAPDGCTTILAGATGDTYLERLGKTLAGRPTGRP
jgi:hypothetical protein